MSASGNAQRHERGYQLFSKGEFEELVELFAPDIVWHATGRNPYSETRRGREEVVEFFATILEVSGGTFNLDAQEFIGNGTHSAALYRVTADRDGRSLDATACEVCRWDNGRLAEHWFYVDDLYAWDEFWS